MAPTPTGTAFCMARPRVRSSRAVSLMLRLPAAASAEYSPSECPATKAASRRTEKPASVSSTRKVASETAINAGWAFSVSCRVSAGPSQMILRQLFAQRRIDLVEHRAGGRKGLRQRLAHADRLGTLSWKSECCRHECALNVPKSLKLRRKTLQGHGCVKPPPVPGRKLQADSVAFPCYPLSPCHRAQNPYKPRHPWIPAGS
jgi:hypothetical protein